MNPLKSLLSCVNGAQEMGNYRQNFIVNHINFPSMRMSRGHHTFSMAALFFINNLDGLTLLDLYFNVSKLLTDRQEEMFKSAWHKEPSATFRKNLHAYIVNNYPSFPNEILILLLTHPKFKDLIPDTYVLDRGVVDFQFAAMLRTFNVAPDELEELAPTLSSSTSQLLI